MPDERRRRLAPHNPAQDSEILNDGKAKQIMKVVGVIAEYNPFHSGHAYHLREAKKQAGADFSVVVMSPDFVQRGEPALTDKYTRTKMALLNGADLVLELPVCYASGSAEYFAQGGVSVLNGLGVVDVLSFGCEGKKEEYLDPALFWKTAGILNQEPDSFRQVLRAQLAAGIGFPSARAAALQKCLQDDADTSCLSESFLKLPNNILGIEYCRAILKFCPQMEILPVARMGSNYHDRQLKGEFCSASALRKALLSDQTASDPGIICGFVPENLTDIYTAVRRQMITADDFLSCLLQKLLFRDRFDDILDISGDLSDRIRSLRYDCIGKTYEEIVELLSGKQITKARIRRALLHLILEIDAAQTEQFRTAGPAHYARMLGFRTDASPLLHEIKKRGSIPLLSKNADAAKLLDDTGNAMLRQDFRASHLYRGIRAVKYGTHFRSEYEMSPVMIRS